MGGTDKDHGSAPQTEPVFQERRVARAKAARRAAVKRVIGKYRLEDFQKTLGGLAIAVFGEQATVVAHLRVSAGREWLTFVVDAADPTSVLQYDAFLPRERAFWTAYAQVVKPAGVQFVVAVRPARGWCRVEALSPLFSMLQPADVVT